MREQESAIINVNTFIYKNIFYHMYIYILCEVYTLQYLNIFKLHVCLVFPPFFVVLVQSCFHFPAPCILFSSFTCVKLIFPSCALFP